MEQMTMTAHRVVAVQYHCITASRRPPSSRGSWRVAAASSAESAATNCPSQHWRSTGRNRTHRESRDTRLHRPRTAPTGRRMDEL